jgi:hypothetical protein
VTVHIFMRDGRIITAEYSIAEVEDRIYDGEIVLKDYCGVERGELKRDDVFKIELLPE